VDDLLVIHKGLESGDRVIVNGIQKVFGDGMPVLPNQVAMRADDDEQPAIAVAQP
jgi:multidrug efflux system membrane fusion protein